MTSTIHEAAQYVLYDQDCNPDTRRKRGEGMQVLGDIFQTVKCEQNESARRQEEKYEQLAFYAVVDAIQLQGEATRTACEFNSGSGRRDDTSDTSNNSITTGHELV